MDPIPVFFENVNRSALILNPKKPFFDYSMHTMIWDTLETPIKKI